MKVIVHKEINAIIHGMIGEYTSEINKNSKMRRCFRCGEPFKLTNAGRYYCDKKCGRNAHYLRFSIRKGR